MSDNGPFGIPEHALTHAGVFHADDVFAAALLRLINPQVVITRSNVVPQNYEELVFDIGGGEFDHHQGNLRYRENGVPYSSFGLLWERFGQLLLHEGDVITLDEQLVQPIDLTDNTGAPNLLSRCISDFNPLEARSATAYDEAYYQAVIFAQGILERRISSLKSERRDVEEIEHLMQEGDGDVLVLPRLVRWKSTVIGSSYLFVVYPSIRGGYNVQCVPIAKDTTDTFARPPQAWWGLAGEKLREASGFPGLTFCHKTGFLMAAETLDDALHIAHKLVEIHRKAG